MEDQRLEVPPDREDEFVTEVDCSFTNRGPYLGTHKASDRWAHSTCLVSVKFCKLARLENGVILQDGRCLVSTIEVTTAHDHSQVSMRRVHRVLIDAPVSLRQKA